MATQNANNQVSPAIGAYMRWLKTAQPYFYKIVVDKYPSAKQLEGLGLTAEPGSDVSIEQSKTESAVNASWSDTIKNLLTTASQVYLTKEQIDAQKKLNDIQLDRVARGLSPLNIDPTTMGLPGPTVSFGMSADTKKMLTYGGIAAAALFLFHSLMGRKRSR